LNLAPAALETDYSNKRLSDLVLAFCQDQLAARIAAAEAEEAALARSEQIPLFICTLAYPHIPTFLHIFEPRYRLMIRRAMETDRKFGMMLYNSRGEEQGELGITQFLRYGTLLEIVNMELLPDGRSLIETVGVSRFCVKEHDLRDGYVVGRVERVDDIPIAEEEALEAAEVSAAAASSTTTNAASFPSTGNNAPLNSLTTAQLLEIGTSFIQRMRLASAPWLSDSVMQTYGRMPEDAAVFPFWFASVLPIDEAEKYRLLPTRSVRARLMICAEWVRRVERMRWYVQFFSPYICIPSSS
jgi:Lon protease-like protein